MNAEKNQNKNIAILVLCLIVSFALALIMEHQNKNGQTAMNGILTQAQVFACVIMVVTNQKRGLIGGIVVQFTGFLSSTINLVRAHTIATLPGILIPFVTVITLSIIYISQIKNQKMQDEIQKQYQELVEASHAMHDKDLTLRTLAYTDSMTSMHNKAYFQEQLDETLKTGQPFTMIYIDLDNFKTINDTFGPKTGDVALIEYANRLKLYCGQKYVVARISGDEFGMLITQPEQTESDILDIVDTLRRLFGEPLTIQGSMVGITASYGIASAPRDGNDSENLLDNAIMATYTAKANGKDRPCFFSQAS